MTGGAQCRTGERLLINRHSTHHGVNERYRLPTTVGIRIHASALNSVFLVLRREHLVQTRLELKLGPANSAEKRSFRARLRRIRPARFESAGWGDCRHSATSTFRVPATRCT